MSEHLALVLGGTRSGKSAHGLALTRRFAGTGRAWFLATAQPGDPELDRRIERHRQQRPADWPTVEVGTDLAGAIERTEPSEPVLIEGLTLWLSLLTGDEPADPDPILEGPLAAALDAIAERRGPVVIVSDEIGLGLVPMHAGARAFRDLVGLAHQRIGDRADVVDFVVAGQALRVKGTSGA